MPDRPSTNSALPIAEQIQLAERAIACHDAHVRQLLHRSCGTTALLLKRHRAKLFAAGAVAVIAGLWLYPRRHALSRKWNALQRTVQRGAQTMAPHAYSRASKWLAWLRSPVVRLVSSMLLPLWLKSRQSGSVSASTTSESR